MKHILPTFRRFTGKRLRLASILLLAGLVVFGWTQRSTAANPSSGTLSVANPTLTYTAGPFAISNPSGTAGEVQCNAQFPCDEYALTVNVPAGYDNTHSIKVTTTYNAPDTDYDLYIRQGAMEVASAASSSNPEVALFDATSGSYTVRNVPYAVAGGSISVRIELIEKAVNPPPPPGGSGIAPRFEVYQPPAAMGNSAGEPTLGVGKAAPAYPAGRAMFIAGLETLRVTFNDCASPATALWEDVSAPTTSVTTLDPILQTDFDTGRTVVSQLAGKASLMAVTDNDGGTNGQAAGDWTPSQGSGINSGVDHQTVGAGPFRPGLPDGVGFTSAFYYASQDIAVAQLALSRDGGITYGAAVPMYNLTQCSGLHGHIQVTPNGANGNPTTHTGKVYVPNKSCGGQQGFATSADEGVTFTVEKAPGSTSGSNDPGMGIDNAGRVYFGYANGDGRMRAAVYDVDEANAANRWKFDQDIGAQLGIKNAVFPTAIGGSQGRAAIAFLGTTTAGDFNNMSFTGVWHGYVSYTYDGGQSWTTVNVTPNDPVQRGSICTSGTTCGADRNLLDFNDITVDREGRVLFGFADGCLNCTAPANSRSAKATIARQSGGRRLFAAFDPVEPTVPKAPKVNSATQDGLGVVTVSWQTPDNGGSAITGYKVSRKTGAAGTYAVVGNVSANRNQYVDNTAMTGVQYFYKVTATNLIGEGTNCGDFPIGAAVALESPCVAPGVSVMVDPAGDGLVGLAQRDIRLVSLNEIYDPAVSANTIYASIKVNAAFLATGPPATSRWTFFFKRTDAANVTTEWFLAMVTDDTANPGTPVYRYGHVTVNPTTGTRTLNTDGTATGSFSGDTIFISTRNLVRTGTGLIFPPLTAGEIFTGMTATTQQSSGVLLINDDSATATTTYPLVGNQFCRPNVAPNAVLTGTPLTGNAPLAVTFSGAGSSDPDTAAPADTIASYTLDFGDGTAPVTQSGPSFTHTYTNAGAYQARLTVRDSRNKVSTNVAAVVIETQQSGPRLMALDLGTTNSGTAQTLIGGCKPDKGRVVLTQAAPAGGFVVTLSDTLNAASVPATVTVPAGQTFVEFLTTTMQLSMAETGTVTARAGSDSFSQALIVRPVKVRSITLSPSNVVTGATTVTGTATLECAMVNPLVAALESSVPSVATVGSSSLNFAANQTTNTFSITTYAQQNKPKATIINATAPGATTVGAKLTVNNQ